MVCTQWRSKNDIPLAQRASLIFIPMFGDWINLIIVHFWICPSWTSIFACFTLLSNLQKTKNSVNFDRARQQWVMPTDRFSLKETYCAHFQVIVLCRVTIRGFSGFNAKKKTTSAQTLCFRPPLPKCPSALIGPLMHA